LPGKVPSTGCEVVGDWRPAGKGFNFAAMKHKSADKQSVVKPKDCQAAVREPARKL